MSKELASAESCATTLRTCASPYMLPSLNKTSLALRARPYLSLTRPDQTCAAGPKTRKNGEKKGIPISFATASPPLCREKDFVERPQSGSRKRQPCARARTVVVGLGHQEGFPALQARRSTN